jgi:hypothetical protein
MVVAAADAGVPRARVRAIEQQVAHSAMRALLLVAILAALRREPSCAAGDVPPLTSSAHT